MTLAACSHLDDFGDLEGTNAEAEYALPLIKADFSLRDVFENFEQNDVLFFDPDGLIRFKYKGDVLTKSSDDVFAAINQGLPSFIPLLEDTLALPFSFPGSLDLDKLILKSGLFLYEFHNPTAVPLTGFLSLPEFTKDGVPLFFDLDIEANGSLTNAGAPEMLVGYNVIPDANGLLNVIYNLKDPEGNTVTLPQVPIVAIQELGLAYAEGYLGQEVYDESRDTIYIDFFDNWINGDIWFEDPRISIFFENSFGVPTRSEVEVFNVFTVRDDVLPLESEFITNGIDFPFPTLDEIGEVKYKEFTFNNENSNIRDILGAGPLALDYDVNALTNPEADATVRGFVTDSSYYKVQIEVDLPFHGKADNFAASDTFEIDLSSYETLGEAEFKLIAENELPLEIAGQVYFQDTNGAIIDSLFEQKTLLIEGAPIDAEGNVTGMQSKTTYIPVSIDHFDNLRKAEKLILVAAFSTTDGGTVSARVLADQKVDIRMGLKIKK